MRWLLLLWLLIVAFGFYGVLTTSGIRWLALSKGVYRWKSQSSCVKASKFELLASVQKKACKLNFDIMPLLADIGAKVTNLCQDIFADQRWNCSSIRRAPRFGNDLLKGTREQAFVYALSSASIVHSVSRMCSNGKLKSCKCSEKPREPPPSDFVWGGCGDNLKHGVEMAKALLETPFKRRKFRRNSTVRVNRHNSRAGWRIADSSRITQCKCHGVSGTCVAKTCWVSIASLEEIAAKLHMKYKEAEEVQHKIIRSGLRWKFFPVSSSLRFTKDDLIYSTKSPDYCEPDPEAGSYGTHGRNCLPTTYNRSSCSNMCCGRGHNLTKAIRHERCNCKHHWCCYVTCDTCTHEQTQYVCL